MLEIRAASVVGSREALVRTPLGDADRSSKTTAVQEGSRTRRPRRAPWRRTAGSTAGGSRAALEQCSGPHAADRPCAERRGPQGHEERRDALGAVARTGRTGGGASSIHSRHRRRGRDASVRPAPRLLLTAHRRGPLRRRGRAPGRARSDDDAGDLCPRDRRPGRWREGVRRGLHPAASPAATPPPSANYAPPAPHTAPTKTNRRAMSTRPARRSYSRYGSTSARATSTQATRSWQPASRPPYASRARHCSICVGDHRNDGDHREVRGDKVRSPVLA
ncbi:MAG: hypothetical protein QOI98_3254 [Solirubrobacteraceae bacterium]|nr:hypothetical protein [Solirubrobacteraceae bacterium]